MAQSPNIAPAIADALQLFAAIRAHHATADEPLTKLRQLADRSRDNLYVQLVAARGCIIAARFDNAIEIAGRAMQAFPTSAEAAQVAAESLYAAGRLNEAQTVGRQWHDRIRGSTLPADVFLANVSLRLNKFSDALQQLQPYIEMALKSPDAHVGVIIPYAQALADLNRIDDAANLLKPFLKSPHWRQLWITIALQLPEKDTHAWLAAVTPYIDTSTNAEQVQLAIAYHQFSLRTHNPEYNDKAIAMIEAMTAKPDCDNETLFAMGTMYEGQNNLSGAEMVYPPQASKNNPDQPNVLNNLAMVLIKKKPPETSEAFSLISQAIKLKPDVPNFYDTAASIQAETKDYTHALASIASAIKLDPNDPEWQITRIWLLALSGDRDLATAELHELKNNPDFATITESSRRHLASLDLR